MEKLLLHEVTSEDEHHARAMMLGAKYKPDYRAYINDDNQWRDMHTCEVLDTNEKLKRIVGAWHGL